MTEMLAERGTNARAAGAVCVAFETQGERVQALRCLFQSRDTDPAQRQRMISAIRSGEAEDDLWNALDPAFGWSEHFFPNPYVEAAPDAERRSRELVERQDLCRARECPTIVQRRIEQLRLELDTTYCNQLHASAQTHLDQPGLAEAGAALVDLIASEPCESGQASRTAALIVGLSRPSTPEAERPTVTGDSTVRDCRTLAEHYERVTGRQCGSLPRYAGAWLSRHCTPEGVSAARRLQGDHPATQWIHDPVADGTQRIVAACAP